jgi:hypothetical protein
MCFRNNCEKHTGRNWTCSWGPGQIIRKAAQGSRISWVCFAWRHTSQAKFLIAALPYELCALPVKAKFWSYAALRIICPWPQEQVQFLPVCFSCYSQGRMNTIEGVVFPITTFLHVDNIEWKGNIREPMQRDIELHMSSLRK